MAIVRARLAVPGAESGSEAIYDKALVAAVKAFQGEGFAGLRRAMEERFTKVYVRKPQASRDRSREVYIVAKGLRS